MSNTLNYPGNLSNTDRDRILGPDMYGAHYRVATTVHYPETDQTKVTLVVVPPADLQQRAQERMPQWHAAAEAHSRIENLFGGAA